MLGLGKTKAYVIMKLKYGNLQNARFSGRPFRHRTKEREATEAIEQIAKRVYDRGLRVDYTKWAEENVDKVIKIWGQDKNVVEYYVEGYPYYSM